MGLDIEQVLSLAIRLPARVASVTCNGPGKVTIAFWPPGSTSDQSDLENVANAVPGSPESVVSDADLALNPPDIYPDPEPVSGNTVYGQPDADPDDVQDVPETGTDE